MRSHSPDMSRARRTSSSTPLTPPTGKAPAPGRADTPLLQDARGVASIYDLGAPITFDDLRIALPQAPTPSVSIFYDGPDQGEIAFKREEQAQIDHIELAHLRGRVFAREVDKHWKHRADPLHVQTRLQAMLKPSRKDQPTALVPPSPAPLVYRDERKPTHLLTRMDDFYNLSQTPLQGRPPRVRPPRVELVRSPKAARLQPPTPRSAQELSEDVVRDMHGALLALMSDGWLDDIQRGLSGVDPAPVLAGVPDPIGVLRDLRDITHAYLERGTSPSVTACQIRSMLPALDRLIKAHRACGLNPCTLVAARELATKCARAA